ncbi:hypothetical protein [Gracilibacillus timonensis]|uniref:hypothetical protein n=1 Tax=Gracilibacillus timonensis TaxID=1816696 RepID=UPI0008251BF7|nr:hypothetical protein [Gracilibacillus timonensis]
MYSQRPSNVKQNIERVAMRVKNGGHHIQTADILRRNEASFKHLYEYAPIIDNLILIDNSKENGETVLEINSGKITFETDHLPNWAVPLKEQFKYDS